MTPAKEKHNSSLGASGELAGAVKGERGFSTADHIGAVEWERRDGKKDQDAANYAKLQGIISDQGAFEKRLFLRTKHTDVLLSVRGATVTGTVPAAMELCRILCAHYISKFA